MNCISYFFAGNKADFTTTLFFKEQYKVWRMPAAIGAMIDSGKLFTGF